MALRGCENRLIDRASNARKLWMRKLLLLIIFKETSLSVHNVPLETRCPRLDKKCAANNPITQTDKIQ